MRNPLHALCPYFAMFPESFVEKHVERYTQPGERVFDPFSGRGTTVLQSLLMGRLAAAGDINPVAYTISGAKADIPAQHRIIEGIDLLESVFQFSDRGDLRDEVMSLPSFFRLLVFYGRFHWVHYQGLILLLQIGELSLCSLYPCIICLCRSN